MLPGSGLITADDRFYRKLGDWRELVEVLPADPV
jgi:hypothetical protein